MVFHGAVLICPAVESGVRTNAVSIKENLNSALCNANIHFLLDVFVWSGVIHVFDRNMIVWSHGRYFPCRQLKRSRRQRQQKRLLFLKRRRPAAVSLLKRLMVERLQPFHDGIVQFRQGQELFISDSGQYEGGNYADSAFHHCLIFWSADSCWDDRRTVMLGKLTVGSIQSNLIAPVPVHSGFQVVALNDSGYSAEIPVGVYVS